MPTTGQQASLSSLPGALICKALTDAFLDQRNACALARTCKRMAEALRPYRLWRTFTLEEALAYHSLQTEDARASPSSSHPPSRWRIGAVHSVSIDESATLEMWLQLPLLASVRDLSIWGFTAWPPRAADGWADASLALPPELTSLGLHQIVSDRPLPLSAFALPATLRSLYMPANLQTAQGLDRVRWPSALVELQNAFDTALVRTWRLPGSLRVLSFGSRFEQPLVGAEQLPDSLTSLTWKGKLTQSLSSFHFPPRLEEFAILKSFEQDHPLDLAHLPASCTRVLLPANRNSEWLAQVRLPVTVQDLSLGPLAVDSYAPLRLPSDLTHLTLNQISVPLHTLQWPLPLRPLRLTLGRCDHALPAGSFPPHLTSLTLGQWDRPACDLALPAGLTSLSFEDFSHPVGDLALPPALISLTFAWGFNQSVRELRLPSSLTHLEFDGGFKQPLTELLLPSSLVSLKVGRKMVPIPVQPAVEDALDPSSPA